MFNETTDALEQTSEKTQRKLMILGLIANLAVLYTIVDITRKILK
jgi:hypothetical protein